VPDFRAAILSAVAEADRLHNQFDVRSRIDRGNGRIDVFNMLVSRDIPIVFKPLKGLLGAFLNEDGATGVMVSTKRPLPVQRFTAAHEFGHAVLGHETSLDDEAMLARMPFSDQTTRSDVREVQANAFASELLMPKWLLANHMIRQGWKPADLATPATVYQLSLRLGTSYAAACNTLLYRNVISRQAYDQLSFVTPKVIKQSLAAPHQPESWHGDVWVVTERDDGLLLEGSRTDLVVFRLAEHSGSGYMWRFEELAEVGLLSVHNVRTSDRDADVIGGVVSRTVIAAVQDDAKGELHLKEVRPWQVGGEPLHSLNLLVDLSGPLKDGLLPAQREAYLGAA